MIADHIRYLKQIVEERIAGRDGSGTPLAGKFFELYPKAADVAKSVPCAALRYLPGRASFHGGYDRSSLSGDTITKGRRLYDAESVYQVDFYSRDIYDFIENDGSYKGFLSQFVDQVAGCRRFAATDGSHIGIDVGQFGVLDDEELILDGLYMAFCRVTVFDGVYKTETATALPADLDKYNVEVNP